MKKPNSGFTLIELLIVIAIVGILAAVALPIYRGHTIRARMVEVENAMATVKSAVSSYHQDTNGTWPDCPDINSIRTSLGVGLGSIERVFSMSVAVSDGTIAATLQNIHAMVDGRTIMLTSSEEADGSIKWNWDYGPGFPIQLRQRGY
jgi:type IV pilus assembly protein PilA